VTTENTIEYASRAPKPLTSKDIFGVVVRSIGFLIALWGVYTVLYFICDTWGLLNHPQAPGAYLIFGSLYIALGAWLMRTRLIADFAYGRD
jgi:hypothetical protein